MSVSVTQKKNDKKTKKLKIKNGNFPNFVLKL